MIGLNRSWLWSCECWWLALGGAGNGKDGATGGEGQEEKVWIEWMC